jgi:hypothetical protein
VTCDWVPSGADRAYTRGVDRPMRQRLFAACVVGAVLCTVLWVSAWRMTTGDPVEQFCATQRCVSSSPFNPGAFFLHSSHVRVYNASQVHPLRAEALLMTAFVLALAAVALHRPWRRVNRQGTAEIRSDMGGSL